MARYINSTTAIIIKSIIKQLTIYISRDEGYIWEIKRLIYDIWITIHI